MSARPKARRSRSASDGGPAAVCGAADAHDPLRTHTTPTHQRCLRSDASSKTDSPPSRKRSRHIIAPRKLATGVGVRRGKNIHAGLGGLGAQTRQRGCYNETARVRGSRVRDSCQESCSACLNPLARSRLVEGCDVTARRPAGAVIARRAACGCEVRCSAFYPPRPPPPNK